MERLQPRAFAYNPSGLIGGAGVVLPVLSAWQKDYLAARPRRTGPPTPLAGAELHK
jgi:hypothetical protein